MISIHDIISSNLLDNIHAVTGLDMIVTLILSFAMGMFILFVYSRVYQGAMYSNSFAVSLTALTMISSTLILAVTSDLVLSLGMVGALSIVRFRTAIKDPLDIVFLFWSIETGIVLATGIYTLAVGINIVIGGTLVALVVRRPERPYILVLRCEKRALNEVEKRLKERAHFIVKSRKVEAGTAVRNGGVAVRELPDDTILELDIEIVLKRGSRTRQTSGFDETEFADGLAVVPGVRSAILVTYNGSYMN